ncbi:hypothetical protein EGW08_011499 [Elysia chlorotica]|uniref:RING-type domain-containing protein n=1 Tax=Elysia chlorotica TaxID=188477 RepID=A0A3S1BCD7_ELYCH|nr:hypothetical protein EGW08_011499 [Elysia chlorotica]
MDAFRATTALMGRKRSSSFQRRANCLHKKRKTEPECVHRPSRRSGMRPRASPLTIYPSQPPLRALDLRPLHTDVDLRMDISIADERQKRRMNSLLKYVACCKVCFLENSPTAYINMPCGHKTNCAYCNPWMKKCAVCQTDILDTVYCQPCPTIQYNGHFCFKEWFG